MQAHLSPLVYTMKYQSLLLKRALPVFVLSAVMLASFSIVFSQSASPREEKLLNGLKLLMFDAPSADKVTLKVRIHAGSAFDPQGKEGLMKLLAANVFPNPEAKEYFADQLGGGLDVTSNYDYIQINATSRPDKLISMIETVAAAIVNMENDKETTAKLKASQLQKVNELATDPSYVADQAASARLLGAFPYGRASDGTAVSIGNIDFADLLAAKQRFFTADNATVAISGKFDQTEAFRAVRRYFGAWLKADKLVPSTFRQPDDPPTGVQMIESPLADKFEVRFITRGTSRSSNDFAAYAIAARILESRLTSAVPAAAPGSVTAESADHVLPGTLVVRISGARAAFGGKTDTTDNWTKAFSTPVGDAEFQSAKQAVIARLDKEDIVDRWLDVGTFKTEPSAKFYARASATSLSDVQTVFSRIQRQPVASVIVASAAKASN
jgi:predicted Zn-dependent peptidase